MKKNAKANAIPLLYPDINDNKNDNEVDTITMNKKESEESFNFNDTKMMELFQRLAQNPSKIANEAKPIISKFIRHSKLMEKVEAEYINEKNQSLSVVCDLCAALLKFKEIKKGEILFRINDIGDKFFFLINGKLSLLKPKDIPRVKLTYEHYLRYLVSLKKKEEIFILNEIIKKNYDQLPIDNLEDVTKIYRILFILKVKSTLNQKDFGLNELETLFTTFNYNYDDFAINQEALKKLWYNKVHRVLNGDSEWERFISKKFKLTTSESVFIEQYLYLTPETESKEWTCAQFEVILFFGNGAFFGDSALDSIEKRRFGSVRAETDSIIAYMKDSDYLSLIAPNRKKQKAKEISFLNDNFFLRNISAHLFEKHYFHKFTAHNYLKNHVLFQSGSFPRELIFLQEGKVEIRVKCSVVDLHNMLKFLIDEITKLPYFIQGTIRYPPILSQAKIVGLKQYLKDSVLTRMKSRAEDFIQEMHRIRYFQLFILAPNEVIGIEEMILKLPYLASARVLTVNASFFKLEADNLNKMISEEKSTFYSYAKLAANKLVSLIERIYHLKTTSVELSLFRVKQNEEELVDSTSVIPYIKNITTASPPHDTTKEKMQEEELKEENKHKIKSRLSFIKVKKGNIKKKRGHKHVIFSNPKIAIDTNRSNNTNVNIDVSSQYSNFDDKIHIIQAKDNKDNSTFIDLKNQFVSLSQIQQEIDGFSSIDESQNVIQVVAQKCNYNDLLNNPSKPNYSHFVNKDTELNCQTMEIAELAKSNFHMSYVPLLSQRMNITPYNSPRRFLSPIKCESITDRSQLRQFSPIENDKIPFIANFKKSAIYSKGIHNQYTTLKSFNSQSYMKNITLEKKSNNNEEINLIPKIVKSYYQSIKNSGYSILANTPHNTFIKKKIQLCKSKSYNDNNNTNTSTKRLKGSKSCQELKE